MGYWVDNEGCLTFKPESISDMGKLKGSVIAHLNIRSIYRKLEEVIQILSPGNIDILCLSETWLNRSVTDNMVSINGYNLIRADRNAESGKLTSGGILVYYKNNLDVSMVNDLCVCSPSNEILWVKLKLKQTRAQFIGTVYRPPGGDLDKSISVLTEHVTYLRASCNCDVMLLGDVNVDTFKAKDSRTRKLNDCYKVLGLSNLIKDVTCHHRNAGTCIDHICVSRTEMFQNHGVIMLNASDHNLVYVVRKQPKVEKSFAYIWGRSYSKFDEVLFERDVIFEDWSGVTNEGDSNAAWKCFATKLIAILKRHTPYK